MPRDDEFGHWTDIDGRLQELHDRLVAWCITTQDGFDAVWADAKERFAKRLEESPDPVGSDKNMAIEAFEEALTAHDTIWMQSLQLARALDVDFSDPYSEDGEDDE